MKKGMENVVVGLVLVLVLVVIGLIVRYTTITEDTQEAFAVADDVMQSYIEEKKAQKRNYLDKLETYEDEDIVVDPTKESKKNVVKVNAEADDTILETVVENDDKKAYAKQLENYEETENKVHENNDELSNLKAPQEGNGDTIADDIAAIVGE
jgi:type II secretory pathway pseudopilin PulG